MKINGKTITGKVDTTNIVKKVSRREFSGFDTRGKVIESKKKYKRKEKHKKSLVDKYC